MTDDLLAFLTARLDEAEATARKVSTHLSSAHYEPFVTIDVSHRSGDVTTVEHVRVYEPAAVLADVEAKRALLRLHALHVSYLKHTGSSVCSVCEDGKQMGLDYPCPTVRLLASAYRHHPGYRAEWAPETTP